MNLDMAELQFAGVSAEQEAALAKGLRKCGGKYVFSAKTMAITTLNPVEINWNIGDCNQCVSMGKALKAAQTALVIAIMVAQSTIGEFKALTFPQNDHPGYASDDFVTEAAFYMKAMYKARDASFNLDLKKTYVTFLIQQIRQLVCPLCQKEKLHYQLLTKPEKFLEMVSETMLTNPLWHDKPTASFKSKLLPQFYEEPLRPLQFPTLHDKATYDAAYTVPRTNCQKCCRYIDLMVAALCKHAGIVAQMSVTRIQLVKFVCQVRSGNMREFIRSEESANRLHWGMACVINLQKYAAHAQLLRVQHAFASQSLETDVCRRCSKENLLTLLRSPAEIFLKRAEHETCELDGTRATFKLERFCVEEQPVLPIVQQPTVFFNPAQKAAPSLGNLLN